ncbi:methyl-accepting chemotaxis protein [Flocculibacter collagenilyticus]|uniref:methyl-accepting chemotaxis protein n=1 Tax=Flocculibacter collagenilyticus TaxID=2744479 RepID=UPI0018F51850|nr:methyl-accepting chemotaxis protein [Flocculibacter collagenilyticus]
MFDAWRNLSIQKKLLTAMAAALILSLGLLTILNNYLTSNIIKNRLENNELPFVMSNIRLNVQKEIALAIDGSKQVAENQYIIDWILNGEAKAGVDNLVAYLDRINRVNKAGETFVGSVNSNDYYTQNGLVKTMSKSNPMDSWYFKFFADKLGYDTGIGPNKDTGELTLFINYLVQDKGEPLGVAGMGVSIQHFVDYVNNFKIGESGRVFVVAKDGTIKIHSNSALADKAKLTSLNGYADTASTLLAGNSFTLVEASIDGDNYFLASDFIEELGWYVIAEVPQSEVYGELNAVTRNSIMITIIVIAIFLFLSVYVVRGISSPIVHTSNLLKQVAQGEADLRQRLPVNSKDELGALAENFNAFISQIQDIIQQVKNNCDALLVKVSEVNQLSHQTSTDLALQKDKTIQVATAVTQMGSTIQDIARSATETASSAEDASNKVAEGSGVVTDTINYIEQLSGEMSESSRVINELAEHTDAIGSVLSVIRGISEQTNLLALNAAIEAARAGEQGRGFAVVADEVRSLAMRTHTSTEEIQQMIEKLQGGSKNAVNAIEAGRSQTEKSVEASTKAGEALQAIDKSVETIQGMSIQMATATEEQSVVVEDINTNVISISDVTQTTAEAATLSSHACEELRALTEELNQVVGRFKV